MADEKKSSPSWHEFQNASRKISNNEVTIKSVQVALDVMKGSFSDKIAKVETEVTVIKGDLAKALAILQQQEMRAKIEAEIKAEQVAARAREEARVNEQVAQRLSIVESTGRHILVQEQVKESMFHRHNGKITAVISAITMVAGWIISYLARK